MYRVKYNSSVNKKSELPLSKHYVRSKRIFQNSLHIASYVLTSVAVIDSSHGNFGSLELHSLIMTSFKTKNFFMYCSM